MIENPRNPRVRAVAKLAKKNARQETGWFLLEGPQLLEEALRFVPDALVEVYATPTAAEKHRELASALADAGHELQFVTEDVLDSMADTVTPQGFISVCRQTPTALKDVFAGSPRLIAVLEEVRDPGNLGTIIRAADAAGADAVVLSGRTVDLYNPKVVRSTTGSLFHLPISVGAELGDVLTRAKAAGLTTIAADIKGADLLAERAAGSLAQPTAWVFGNEARGLEDEHLQMVDKVVTLPIYGQAESLNLATAASVCLYESAFAHRG